jgi:hypothetical protein
MLNSGNATFNSESLSSRLLSGHIHIRLHETISIPVVLYRCETWPLILREEHKMRMFENRVLKGMYIWVLISL